MQAPSTSPSARGVAAWLAARARPGVPGRPSPFVAGLLRTGLRPLIRLWWRPRLVGGWDAVPADRACMVVANHSGSGQADVISFALLALERPGGPPRLAGLAHPLAFFIPGVAGILRGLGAVPSSFEHAAKALEAGASLIVFPGGDHEGFRPIWQARRVDFAGRQGFLRLAREARVPVVPLGIWGAHFTQPILWRSRLLPWLGVLPRALGLKRLPLTVPWLAGAVAIVLLAGSPWLAAALLFAWAAVPLASFIPWVPWPVRMAFGPPIEPGEADYDLVVERVRQAMERARAG